MPRTMLSFRERLVISLNGETSGDRAKTVPDLAVPSLIARDDGRLEVVTEWRPLGDISISPLAEDDTASFPVAVAKADMMTREDGRLLVALPDAARAAILRAHRIIGGGGGGAGIPLLLVSEGSAPLRVDAEAAIFAACDLPGPAAQTIDRASVDRTHRAVIEQTGPVVAGWALNIEDREPVCLLVSIVGYEPVRLLADAQRPDIAAILGRPVRAGYRVSFADVVAAAGHEFLRRAETVRAALPEMVVPIEIAIAATGETVLPLAGVTLPILSGAALAAEAHEAVTNIVEGENRLLRLVPRSSATTTQDETAPSPTLADTCKLFFFPDYTATNPYQDLLYANIPAKFEAQAGTIEDAILSLDRHGQTIFHLHWPEAIFAGCTTLDEFTNRGFNFLSALKTFQRYGGRFIWTVHNILPHDGNLQERYSWFLNEVSAAADRIHIHSIDAIELLGRHIAVNPAKCDVIPHGSYLGVYPATLDKASARQRLDIAQDRKLFVFLGQLRPYKGLNLLLEAFRAYRAGGGDGELLLAGKPVHPTRAGHWSNVARVTPGLHVFEGYVRDEDLQLYLTAADAVVLPYTDILTSGSALLACSFSRLVVIPELRSLRDISEAGFAVTYEPGSVRSLTEVLHALTGFDAGRTEAMQTRAATFARSRGWDIVGERFETLLSEVMPRPAETIRLNGHDLSLYDGPANNAGIGIAIVNYRSSQDVIELLATIPSDAGGLKVHCFILDNSASLAEVDAIRRAAPMVSILLPAVNLGYAGGNNAILKLMQQRGFRYGFILNPDVRLQADTLDTLVEAALGQDDFVANPLVLKEDGRISYAGGFVKRSGDVIISHYLDGALAGNAPGAPYEVDVLNGCAVFLDLAVLNKAGHIPEDYFLYYEETDWFLRMKQHGIPRRVIPGTSVIHNKRSHGTTVPSLYYFYYLVRSAYIFNAANDGAASAVSRRQRNIFIKDWSAKLQSAAPSFLPIFERAVHAGMKDGIAGVKGPIDLATRLDLEPPARMIDTVGMIEHFDGDDLVGWIAHHEIDAGAEWRGNDPLWLIVDDVPLAQTVASLDRPDTLDAGYARHTGFRFAIPQQLRDGGVHRIEVRSGTTGRCIPFQGGEPSIEQRFAPARQIVVAQPEIKARVDGITGGKLVGWAYDINASDRPVFVDIDVNGRIMRNILIDGYRKDLRTAGMGNGNHGMAIPLPLDVLNQENVTVKILTNQTNRIVTEKQVRISFSENGYRTDFMPQDFFRWSFTHNETPVGSFQQSPALLEYFASNRLSLAGNDRPQDITFSIIMPVYNREAVVIDAIDSIVGQHYRNWELLIVDDGSSDLSADVVSAHMASLDDPRISLHRLDRNRGVSAARNVGLSEATGDWIAYLDSDNQWYPEYLGTMAQALADNSAYDTAYAGQEIWERMRQFDHDELRSIRACPFNRSKLETRNFIDLNVFVHRRRLIDDEGGFREDMRRLVDWDLILRYTLEKPPLFVPSLLNKYFVNTVDNQITRIESFTANIEKLRSSIKRIGRM